MQSVRRILAIACLLLIVPFRPAVHASTKSEISRQIRFGADMAREGNWREAIFRWQRSLKLDPDNPRIHNNLAVAYESLGEYDKALAEYRAALAIPGYPAPVMENNELFLKFYTRFKEDTSSLTAPHAAETPKTDAPTEPVNPADKDTKEPGGAGGEGRP